MGRITQNELHESVNTEINKVSKIGDITQLHTTDKSSLVSAINEVEETLARELADYGQDTGAVNTYAITLNPAPIAYEIGKVYKLKAANANTGASTFAIGALTATAIKKNVSVALGAGDIPAGAIVSVVYDGTNFQLIPVNPLMPSLLTAQGDIIYAAAAGTPTRLAKGTASQLLAMNPDATAPEWKTVSLSDGAWEKIAEAVISVATNGVYFYNLGLETYRYFRILFSALCTNSSLSDIYLKLNGVSTGYRHTITKAATSLTCFSSDSANQIILYDANAYSSYGAASGEILISNLSGNQKDILADYSLVSNSNAITRYSIGGKSNVTALVTDISLVASANNFDVGTQFILLGVK